MTLRVGLRVIALGYFSPLHSVSSSLSSLFILFALNALKPPPPPGIPHTTPYLTFVDIIWY